MTETKQSVSGVKWIEEGQLYQKVALVKVVGQTETHVGVTHDFENNDRDYGISLEQFEQIYKPFYPDFGWALQQLREGKKVARKGWNASGQWVVLMPALYLDAGVVNSRTTKHIGQGVDLDSQPYFTIFTAQKKWQPGWVPSTSDVLSLDWEVVE